MTAVLSLYGDQFLVFVLVLSRVSGLMIAAPIYGSRSVPMQIRALVAVALSLLIAPVHWETPVEQPGHLFDLMIYVGQELVLGLMIGLGVQILFMGLQVAGQVVTQMSALSLADVFDPSFDNSMSVFSQLFEVIALSVFLLIGGHRYVMSALLDMFRAMPPGDVSYAPDVAHVLVEILSQSFLLGVRAAAPAIVALLMAILVLGLISRTLPQLNVLAVGFSVNTMVLMATLALSIGPIVWIFQDHLEPALHAINTAMTERFEFGN